MAPRAATLLVVLALHAANALLIGVSPAVTQRGAVVMLAKKAAKTVTVLLDADVDGLGSKGELVQVKPAYADNFIVAKGMGSLASKELIEQVAREAEEAAAAAAAARKAADEARSTLQATFGKIGIINEVQVGPDGKISESVDSAFVADAIKRATSITVATDDIEMPEVTEIGSVVAEVKLHPEVSTTIKIEVVKSKIVFV